MKLIQHVLFLAGALAMCAAACSCARDAGIGPPTVAYDSDECKECGMIVSDARYACATMIEGDRGATPVLFDDFNCQVNYENAHPDQMILARWTHDHGTREWIATAAAHFVRAKSLYTPMMAHVAAFASATDADAFAKESEGQRLTFEELWDQLGQ